MLRGGWFIPPYPQVVGHEVVGIAVRVGKDITHIKVGDRVGLGAQVHHFYQKLHTRF